MADNGQTQKTQPKTDAAPTDIPVPTRERVFGDLRRIAPPVPAPKEAESDEDR
jgi:hypothetical protein